VAFLDLNGTLAQPLQADRREFTSLPGALDALRALTEAGIACPIITVQGRIGTGQLTRRQFHAAFRSFRQQADQHGATLDGLYLCPHPATHACPCRKPRTHLYERAARNLSADPTRSWVIGDTSLDLAAARLLGIRAILVRTGHGQAAEHDPTPRDAVVDNVLAAANHILDTVNIPAQQPRTAPATVLRRSAGMQAG
jgi:D-glycero-D-manno-heptose 1,7-bisphosphate phosphatase